MERGLVMVVHGVSIAIIAYVIMVYVLKLSQTMAENRSVLLGSLAVAYMVVFGHKAPSISSIKKL